MFKLFKLAYSGGAIKLANVSGIFKNSKYYTKTSQISADVTVLRVKCSIDYLTLDAVFASFPQIPVLIGKKSDANNSESLESELPNYP